MAIKEERVIVGAHELLAKLCQAEERIKELEQTLHPFTHIPCRRSGATTVEAAQLMEYMEPSPNGLHCSLTPNVPMCDSCQARKALPAPTGPK